MVDQLAKFLRKQDKKTRHLVLQLIRDILEKKWEGYDIKKLQGESDLYRLRKGSIRIIFAQQGATIIIKWAGRRNENTYSDL